MRKVKYLLILTIFSVCIFIQGTSYAEEEKGNLKVGAKFNFKILEVKKDRVDDEY